MNCQLRHLAMKRVIEPRRMSAKAIRGVTLTCNDGLAVFTINRPEVRNAINFQVLRDIKEGIEELKFNKKIRTAILSSNSPGIFCAGADLKERCNLPDSEYRRWSLTIRALTTSLAMLPMPVLAAMDGHALGGGLELALACDIRIAASNIRLGLPETSLGIIPGAGGTQRLPRLVGAAFAKEMIFTGRSLCGEEAYRRGVVNHVVPPNQAGDAAYECCIQLSQCISDKDPFDIQMAKYATNTGWEVD